MLNYAAIGTVKREKRRKKVTGTVVWVEGYDPVDVTNVYIVYSNSSFFFRLRVVHGDSEFYKGPLSWVVG